MVLWGFHQFTKIVFIVNLEGSPDGLQFSHADLAFFEIHTAEQLWVDFIEFVEEDDEIIIIEIFTSCCNFLEFLHQYEPG